MSGSCEDYDGLCGIIDLHSNFDLRIRCRYDFGHEGPHSFDQEGPRHIMWGSVSITRSEVKRRAANGSVAAKAILIAVEPKK